MRVSVPSLRAAVVMTITAGAAQAEPAGTPALRLDTPPTVTQLIVKPRQFALAQAARIEPLALSAYAQAAGVPLTHARSLSGQSQALRLPRAMTPDEAAVYARRLEEAGLVDHAVPDRWIHPASLPNDPLYTRQWDMRTLLTGRAYGGNTYGVNLPDAWTLTTGSAGVVVAVLDTGILPHIDLAGQTLAGHDFVSDSTLSNDGDGRDADPADPGDWVSANDTTCGTGSLQPSSWHGTHVAGTIGAQGGNGIGISGAAWRVGILPVRVMGRCGGQLSDVLDAMRWSVGLGVPGVPSNPAPAKVLNMSFGTTGACDSAMQQAINDVRAKGAVMVVAAGNYGEDAAGHTPAGCGGVISVAATDRQGQRAYYSNYGTPITLSAPGGDEDVDTGILSTSDSGATTPAHDNAYLAGQGTSMAAAHVSGIAALMLARNAGLSPDMIQAGLTRAPTPFPSYAVSTLNRNCDTLTCGSGIANALTALLATGDGDAIPDAFSFLPQVGVPLGAWVTSNAITVTGINAPSIISVSDGEYSIGCSPTGFTSSTASIGNGQAVCVRHVAAGTPSASITTTLSIGGVSGSFISTTLSTPPPPEGGGGSLGLLGVGALFGLAGWRRRRVRAKRLAGC